MFRKGNGESVTDKEKAKNQLTEEFQCIRICKQAVRYTGSKK
jgi:hypothetical protein